MEGGREAGRAEDGARVCAPLQCLTLSSKGIHGWILKFVLYLQDLLFV